MPRSRSLPPPLGAVLTSVRNALGWKQNALARVLGIRSHVISELEKGARTLTRRRLDDIAARLGLAPEAVDLTLLCTEVVQPRVPSDLPLPPLGLTAEDRKAVDDAVVGVVLSTAQITRSHLTRALLEERIQRDRQEAEQLWEYLKGLSPADQRELISGAREYQSWALCERLCAESTKAAADQPSRALQLAELALEVASLVPGDEAWRSHLKGFAWAHIGNARRVGNDLEGADDAFARAWSLWACLSTANGLSPLEEWRMLDLEASLRRDQRRMDEAVGLLDRALVQCGTNHAIGRILLNKAFTLEQLGDFEGSAETLRKAIPVIQKHGDPRLLFGLLFNLSVNLCHLGRHTEAESLLIQARDLAIQLGNDLDLIRCLWLQGRVDVGLGRVEKGLSALLQVRAEFFSRALPFDMALASLELAQLYLTMGQVHEVKILADQLSPLFRAQGHKEALAALKLFCDAAEKEAVTAELLQRLITYFQRARQQPQPKFSA